MLRTGSYLQDRYEVLGLIGSGGMSDVYKARCHKLNRLVAVKVLKAEFSSDAGFVSKFKMEAQAAARLSHPNIVSVYDVVDEAELHYIVMELIEGITLKSYITKKKVLDVKEAVGISIQVASGIAAAHGQNIIHRDIKPQNMIISKNGKVKVADFGIARAATTQTLTAAAMGSVHYISPEQARGGYSDARSDIYSLGITMYEMVTGHVPFEGDNTVTVALAHLEEPIIRPGRYQPGIPVSLENIILKCTEKKPEHRYNTMNEVIADLRRVLLHPEQDFVSRVSEQDFGGETVTISPEELTAIRNGQKTYQPDRESAAERQLVQERQRGSGYSPDYRREGGYPAETDYRGEPGYRGVPDYSEEPGYHGIPDYPEEPDYRDMPDYPEEAGYHGQPDYQEDFDYSEADGYGGASGYQGQPDYRRGGQHQKTQNRRRSQQRIQEEEVNPKFEKLLTSAGVFVAVLIMAVLVFVFFRLGGIFRFHSDKTPTTIQAETVAAEETLDDKTVYAPDARNLPVDMAEAKLKESTLVMKVVGYEESDTVNKDYVISQSPAYGSAVSKYSTVEVIVSSGNGKIDLSQLGLVGMEGDAARLLMEQKKMVPELEPQYSDIYPEGRVVGFEPQEAKEGEKVTLYISAGSAADLRTVPGIINVPEEEALALLEAADLLPGEVTKESSDTVPSGTVISQGVAMDTQVRTGTQVPYVVSTGPEEKRFVAAISETYELEASIGPGAINASVVVAIRLKQEKGGETVYTTLMEPKTLSGGELLPVNFPDIEGAPNVEYGEVEVVNVQTDTVLKSYPVRFFETE